jgi:RNA polymerase sigma-70 factor (ECF subfamily)
MPIRVFATTQWNVVLQVRAGDDAVRQAALEHLCRTYWYPLYGEIRRRGHDEHDAQDLTQEFFACLLRRGSFAAATPVAGRFRSYLLGALDHFLSDARARDSAVKRGGRQEIVSLEAIEAEGRYIEESAANEPPARAFDRRWLMAVLEAGLLRLEAEQASAGKARQYARLKVFLASETDAGAYRQAAEELGMKTGTIAVAVHRLRQRYQQHIRAAVRETLSDPDELDDELRHLFGNSR